MTSLAAVAPGLDHIRQPNWARRIRPRGCPCQRQEPAARSTSVSTSERRPPSELDNRGPSTARPPCLHFQRSEGVDRRCLRSGATLLRIPPTRLPIAGAGGRRPDPTLQSRSRCHIYQRNSHRLPRNHPCSFTHIERCSIPFISNRMATHDLPTHSDQRTSLIRSLFWQAVIVILVYSLSTFRVLLRDANVPY